VSDEYERTLLSLVADPENIGVGANQLTGGHFLYKFAKSKKKSVKYA
jgi:leucyl aminopeptidase